MAADDSALFHAGTYDPAKARAYYLRNRHLKGRKAGSGQEGPQGVGIKRPPEPPKAVGGHVPPAPHGAKVTPQTLEEHKAALEARLDRLKEVLRTLVEQAKGRSGVSPKGGKTAEQQSSAKEASLTPQQKREAHDRYEKNKKSATSRDAQSVQNQIEAIQKKIADVRKRIQAALEADRNQTATSKSKTTGNGR